LCLLSFSLGFVGMYLSSNLLPTRWRGSDTPHILDLIITNEENMISDIEYQSPLGKSDHCMMKFRKLVFAILFSGFCRYVFVL
jgi:hypothetical protein